MIGGGGGDRGGEREASPPSSNSGGQFLLQLLQRNHASPSPPPPQPPPSHAIPPSVRQHPHPHQDPAVAAMGSTLPFPTTKPKNGHDLPPPSWLNNNPCIPHEFFPHPWNLAGSPPPSSQFPVNHPIFPEDFQRLGLLGNGKPSPSQHYQQQQQPRVETQFGVQKAREVVVANKSSNGVETRFDSSRNREFDRQVNSQSVHYAPHELFERSRATTGGGGGWGSRPQQQQQQKSVHHTPPGFKQKSLQRNVDNQNQVNGSSRLGLSRQLDHPGPPVGSKLHSVPALEIEESLADFHLRRIDEEDRKYKLERWDDRSMGGRHGQEDLAGKFMDAVMLRDRFEKKNGTQHYNDFREKDFRSDTVREMSASGQRMRNNRRVVGCRSDIDRMNSPFITIYESLVPAEEEKAKQKQLLTSLEKLVNREWPKAELYLYGSCANSFGVSNSDIDICLSIKDVDTSKSEILLKLAEILESDNLENVQALTRARVPIVKLLDPETGISCDICINNVLAVVNTKLLRDYAQIDDRLRQLAFIVKHWAKLRGVNVTYQGTLSSYAYVLMCIHFLQQRKPAILPCLQRMEVTYAVTVDDLECAYFDRVENLRGYGAENKESIAELVWAFFDYWAYRHDYTNAVISVRTGSIISKREKDWTRRIGNDRHLICIEDPFELSHDLGRVVDKHSIKILRQEFERAASVMQFDPDPCVTLFEPYVPS